MIFMKILSILYLFINLNSKGNIIAALSTKEDGNKDIIYKHRYAILSVYIFK